MASLRWGALQATVAALQTIVPAGPPNNYTYNLSGIEAVTLGVLGKEARLQRINQVSVQVGEGLEQYSLPQISPDTLRRSTFVITLNCLLRDDIDAPARQRLNDLLRDINICIGQNPTLGSNVVRAWVARVDEPQYSEDERTAGVLIHLAVEYEYMAGSTF